MKSGWYGNIYFVVKPLRNGHRQSLIMGVQHYNGPHWAILMGVFSSNISYESMIGSRVWRVPTSTNKNPSIKVLSIALEALNEIEQEIHQRANGKRAYIHVDGMNEKRLRVYTKVLTAKCGYKKSSAKSQCVDGLHQIYKRV